MSSRETNLSDSTSNEDDRRIQVTIRKGQKENSYRDYDHGNLEEKPETSYARSDAKWIDKEGVRCNATDEAKERAKMPPDPEKVSLTSDYRHLLRSQREFGGVLAGTREEASEHYWRLQPWQREELRKAMNGEGSNLGEHYLQQYKEIEARPPADNQELREDIKASINRLMAEDGYTESNREMFYYQINDIDDVVKSRKYIESYNSDELNSRLLQHRKGLLNALIDNRIASNYVTTQVASKRG